MELGLNHKPQLRHVQKTAPRPFDPMVGRNKNEALNEDIVEAPKSNDPSVAIDNHDNEPEVLDRQLRVSRNVNNMSLRMPCVTASTWKQNEGVVVARILRLQHHGLLTVGYCYTSILDTNASGVERLLLPPR